MAPTPGTISLSSSNGQYVTLTCSAATGGTGGPYNYQWYVSVDSGFTPNNGSLISGATGLTLNNFGKLSYNKAYYFAVRVTDTGDSSTATTAVFSYTPTSQTYKINLAFWGDSITYGQNASSTANNAFTIATNKLRGLLGPTYTVNAVNSGVPGSDTASWQPGSTNYNNAVSAANTAGFGAGGYPSYIHLMFGRNDARLADTTNYPISKTNYKARLQNIINSAKNLSYKPKIIISGPIFAASVSSYYPTANLNILEYHQAIVELATENRDVFIGDISAYRHFELHPSELSATDGVHPTDAGYSALGELWANAIWRNIMAPSLVKGVNQITENYCFYIHSAPTDEALAASAISSSTPDCTWKSKVNEIYQIASGGSALYSWSPTNPTPSLTKLTNGEGYFINAKSAQLPFSVNGVVRSFGNPSPVVDSSATTTTTTTAGTTTTTTTTPTTTTTTTAATGTQPETTAYVTNTANAGYTLSTAEQTAINNFILSAKNKGYFNNILALRPNYGNAASAMVYLISPAGVTAATAVGGVSYSANNGLILDGSTGYINSGLNPAALGWTETNTSLWIWTTQTRSSSSKVLIGIVSAAGDSTVLGWLKSGTTDTGTIAGQNNSSVYAGGSTTSLTGFLGVQPGASRLAQYYQNGAVLGSAATLAATGLLANLSFYEGARNNNGTADLLCASNELFAVYTKNLTAQQASDLYTDLSALGTALGRQLTTFTPDPTTTTTTAATTTTTTAAPTTTTTTTAATTTTTTAAPTTTTTTAAPTTTTTTTAATTTTTTTTTAAPTTTTTTTAGTQPETTAYQSKMATAGYTLSAPELTAFNNWWITAKGRTYYSKILALRPNYGSAAAALVYMIAPAGVTATATNSPTYAATTGLTYNGTNNYVDSGLNLSTLGYDPANLGLWVWTPSTRSGGSKCLFGAVTAASETTALGWFKSGTADTGTIGGQNNTGVYPTGSATSVTGLLGVQSGSGRLNQYYRNGAALGAAATVAGTGGLPNGTLVEGARRNLSASTVDLFCAGSQLFVAVTQQLTTQEVSDFYTDLLALNTALGR